MKFVSSILAATILALLPSSAFADGEVDWQVISSSPTTAGSDSFSVSGTLGQPVVGAVGDGTVNQGFWQSFEIGDMKCCRLRGDVDYSGDGPDISDLIYMVGYMFQQGPIPFCLGNADINGSGEIPDISDVTALVSFMFQQGATLPPCPASR